MIKARVISLTLLLVIGFTFQNCDPYDCGNITAPAEAFFDIKGVELSHLIRGTDRDEITFTDYAGIQLLYLVDYITETTQKSSSWNFSMMNTAMACSPLPQGYKGSKIEHLTKVTIITTNDFDDDHLAGSSINDLMTIESNLKKLSVDNYNAQDHDLIQYIDSQLILDKAPELNTNFQVTVTLELSTGEIYEATSSSIKIN